MGKEVSGVEGAVNVDAARNGYLRRATVSGFRKVAEKIHTNFPTVSPNHVTLIGLGIEVLGTRLAELQSRKENPSKGVLVSASILKSVGYGLDGVDGPLSKFKPQHNTDVGQILDYAVDRIEESDAAFSRARGATTQVGRLAGWGVAVTCNMPGIARALTEEKGKVVPEHGRNALELFGTRPGRVLLDMVATFLPQVQTGIDILGTSANVYSTVRRVQDGQNANGTDVLSQEKRDQAKARRKVLSALLIANGAAVYKASQNKKY